MMMTMMTGGRMGMRRKGKRSRRRTRRAGQESDPLTQEGCGRDLKFDRPQQVETRVWRKLIAGWYEYSPNEEKGCVLGKSEVRIDANVSLALACLYPTGVCADGSIDGKQGRV
jgi:hypothetical protein